MQLTVIETTFNSYASNIVTFKYYNLKQEFLNMNTKYLSAYNWPNNIKLIHTRPPVKIKSVIQFNQEKVEVVNLRCLTIKLNNWFDEGHSENHSSIQFGYISDSELDNKYLFYLTIPKNGTASGSYDALKSNIHKVLDMADEIMEQFQLQTFVQSDIITLHIVQNFDDNTVRIFDFIQIATPILKQLGLFD